MVRNYRLQLKEEPEEPDKPEVQEEPQGAAKPDDPEEPAESEETKEPENPEEPVEESEKMEQPREQTHRNKMYHAGLVLEGGGMKGFYTAGVLDFFLEQGIFFSRIYGVSAGACHMTSYLSRQKGRGRDVIMDNVNIRSYCGPLPLFLTGDFFNVDYAYHLVPDLLNPFDYDTYAAYPGKAYAVVTNIVTGEPEYLEAKDLRKDMDKIQASASLPLISRTVRIGKGRYLDGGISDAIPLQQSIWDGDEKNIVVMTKEIGYVRKPESKAALAAIRARYARYPKMYEIMRDRHVTYNQTLDLIEECEEDGRAFVLRPQHKGEVGRIEKDEEKLMALYNEGYADAEKKFEAMMAYLADTEYEEIP